MNFTEKVVLITGTSSGIGAATAIHFSSLGASVFMTGRNLENLKKVANQCKGPTPYVIVEDMTNEQDVQNIVDSIVKKFGKLDVLINNAGIFEVESIEDMKNLEPFDRIFATNVRTVYQMTMLAIPHLIKTKGNIINVSSVCGLRSLFSKTSVYCMSKAALDQMTRCVALDLGPKQVRVNAVNPGVIATNIFERGGMSSDRIEELYERGKETHALGRIGASEEVAKGMAFLASDDSIFITGVTLSIDRGKHAICPLL